MYSNKPTVNILTSLLIAKGVKKAVVCPGSRNIPIVHNLSECKDIECFPVTDERSAAFYALGISLTTGEPVAVCVTSGSALMNTSPAIAEAYNRHVPLIVISADRPVEWIDRLDGQTMLQTNALANMVKSQADIPNADEGDWSKLRHAGMLLNRVLNDALTDEPMPVHINIHIGEPLFDFTVDELPAGNDIKFVNGYANNISSECEHLVDKFLNAENKLLVIGQLNGYDSETDRIIRRLSERFVILNEPLSSSYSMPFDRAIKGVSKRLHGDINIDFLLSTGGNLVSKMLRTFLRDAKVREHWDINRSGKIYDTFMKQTGVVCCDEKKFLRYLYERATAKEDSNDGSTFLSVWKEEIAKVSLSIERYEPRYSQLMAVKQFELSLEDMEYNSEVHYANSMAVRLGCMYANHYIWCNRGINGIEGSISTAAGFSLATDAMVFCITGDLSFFYDQNSLWNTNLRGNLRIMIINNGGGFIFRQFKELDSSHGSMPYITGQHVCSARGICEQNDIGYLSARNEVELQTALVHFLTEQTSRPMVMEVFTDAEEDKAAFDSLREMIIKAKP